MTAADNNHPFANRLRKNLKNLRRWARREGISCYRLYDRDLPEFALAIDLYQPEPCNDESAPSPYLHVQEYAPPTKIDPEVAESRIQLALAQISETLETPSARIAFKRRQRQRGSEQYQRHAEGGERFIVREGAARFWINLTDYLDSGLFLDHRTTRAMLAKLAAERRVLNLFAYTSSASVHAALGGAVSTTSVDLSATYLDWSWDNFQLNGLQTEHHRLIRADCLQWLAEAARSSAERRRYDLIFLDPPTFSNSKRMQRSFDVQRDHVELIRQLERLLSDSGILIFSNNNRRFQIDLAALQQLDLKVSDISSETIPRDFQRNPRIHRCWRIEHARR